MRNTKMSPRLQNQITTSKEQALAAFVSKKAEINAMLTRLEALSDNHFNYSPDEIDWSHVGTLRCYVELLKRATDSAFKEREHAGVDAAVSRPRPDRVRPRGSGS
jgi:hypothetical protein